MSIKKAISSMAFMFVIAVGDGKNMDALSRDHDPAHGPRPGCTKDLMHCPGGGYVVRDPRRGCEFGDCLSTSEDAKGEKGEIGKSDGLSLDYLTVWTAKAAKAKTGKIRKAKTGKIGKAKTGKIAKSDDTH